MGSQREDVFEITRHAAQARLSRVIRNSEAGWLFYAPDGTAYHVLSDEAALLERRGLRRIEKCSWLAQELAKLPGVAFKLAWVTLAVNIGLTLTLGKSWASAGEFVNTYVFPGLILFALFFGFFRPAIALALRSTIMLSWQNSEARKLRRRGRGSVPELIETRHRRYNLFRIVFTVALGTLAVRFAAMWMLTPSEVRARGFDVEIICLAIMGLTMIPARLIDMTHIRRKWLD